jgi:hypothetical protein
MVTSIYYILSFITTTNLIKVKRHAVHKEPRRRANTQKQRHQNRRRAPQPPPPLQSCKLLNIGVSNQIWRAPMAAAALGGLLVLVFNILSCGVLVRCVPNYDPTEQPPRAAFLLPHSQPTPTAPHHIPPPQTPPTPRSKSIEKRGGPGMAYGFIMSACFTLSFFVLLCGLVLDGFKEVVAQELQVKRE